MLNFLNCALGRVASQISKAVTSYILAVVLEYSVCGFHFICFLYCKWSCVCGVCWGKGGAGLQVHGAG